MARYIVEVRRELGMILVEHDMRLVMDLADRVLITPATPSDHSNY